MIERVIQQAILQVLTPIFDPEFSESSFGFRPGRSAHDAAKQVQTHIRAGYRHCVDMDLSKFFDRVQHDVLMAKVSRKVDDKRLLKLIGRYLRAGVMVDTLFEPTTEFAFTHGNSSKGPWVLSSTWAVQQALSTALLAERGLPSLLAIYEKFTARDRTA